MTTHSNNANNANAKANDSKKGAVICQKNRLYDLPSELENYIYSFVEDSQHKTAYKKLHLDNTFIKLMWENFDESFLLNGLYDEDEIQSFDIELGIMELTRAKYKHSAKYMLPSHISINYEDEANFNVKVVGQDDLKIIHYTDEEVEEKVVEYLKDEEHLLYLCPYLLYGNVKDETHNLGIDKKDIVKLQQDENYMLLKKLVDIDEVKNDIINDCRIMEDLADSIFCSDYTYTRLNGALVVDDN